MGNIIEMQDMRYLNLFEKVTGVNTRFCFKYNEAIIFCVNRSLISKAIGGNAENAKKISSILRRKIKVVAKPNSIEDASKFIGAIVSPVVFKKIDVTDGEIILTAGPQSKAALIGRNKRRLIEMQKIVKTFFNRDFRII